MSDLNLHPGAVQLAPATLQTANGEFSSSQLVERDLVYWRQKLAGIPAILELPTDRPRPPAQSFRAGRESLVFPQALKRNIEALSTQVGLPFSVVLLAAFQTLLARYTRQDDIVVGSVLATGDQLYSRKSVQRFTSLPVRTDMSGDLTFRQLLTRVNDSLNEACEHQNITWERLVEAVQPDRDPSRHPVFQTEFSLESSLGLESTWEAGELAPEPEILKVDLQLQLRDEPEGLQAIFTYSADLFDSATIVRMAGHFEKLLEGIVADPEQPIAKLPLLTPRERQQLVVEWNATGIEYARDKGIHQLFEAQAAQTPNAVAVVFQNRQLTYGELDRRANQLARHLLKLGAAPDGLIGICVERSLDMIVGLLGILKAGSAYVPLDPAYPADRIAFMLEDAEAPLLITQSQLVEHLPRSSSRRVLIDSDWHEIALQSEASPALTVDPSNRAYVIYTSGSTGKPKGVQITHRAVVNFLTTMAQQPGLHADDRLLAVTTLCFDIAGLEIYLPLTQGASVEIVSREIASDGNELLAKLASSSATVMQATPATWRMLLEAGWTGDRRLKILIGGEAVSQKLAQQLLERSGSVWNVYGPTETTIWSTISKLEVGLTAVTIGRPIGNTEIFILDKLLQPVPIGVAGELHIGGDGLARGYLKRPELTAEKFIAHPLNPDPKARLYKTGDLVRYLPNGNIEFLGRIDHQVKIRGFRIELGEIETVLRAHPAINDTVVVAREDTPGDKRVVAYFVPIQGASPTTSELRSFMREKLPEYMLPSVFVTLASMPLTPNGKVDRRALPVPQPGLGSGEELATARDATEQELVHIWESILGVQPIGITQDFFDLGGHSLLAVRLMTRVEQTFGHKLPVATLLQARTIEKLAVLVRQGGASSPWSSLVPIQVGGSRPPFFCIHGAGGVVIRFYELAQHLGPDQPVYGLQARGLDGKHPCDTCVEDMAAHYLEEIRSVQPQGPYLLGGYSLGGLIALEIAQKLIATNQEDVLVVLFDTFCPSGAGANGSNGPNNGLNLLYQNLSASLQKWVRMSAAEKWQDLARIARTSKDAIHRRISHMTLPGSLKNVRGACETAARTYVPHAYPGRLILFRSRHRPLLQFEDPHVGWSRYAEQGLEIHEVDGNHDSILLEPQVRTVAGELKNYLKAAAQ